MSIAEKDAKMTDPKVVADFLSRTKADALAVTIGNVHGKYAVNPPVLDWERLDAVRAEAGGTPLVLHGASGLPDEFIRRAISASVCKFNVNTEVRAAAREAVAKRAAEGRMCSMSCRGRWRRWRRWSRRGGGVCTIGVP